jgi:hypothetical protein
MEDERTSGRRTTQPAKQPPSQSGSRPAKQVRPAPAALFVEPKIPPSQEPVEDQDGPGEQRRVERQKAVRGAAQPPAQRPPAEAPQARSQRAPAREAAAQEAPARKAPGRKAAVQEAPVQERAEDPPAVRRKAAATSRATPTKRATVKAKATPAKKATRAPVKAAAEQATPPPRTTPAVPAPLWERVRANPRYAPELVTLAAVEVLGRQADLYTRWLRDTYPYATPDALARYAHRRYGRRKLYGLLAGTTGGPLGTVAEAVALAWSQVGLVLHVAAAYGHSPTDRERAAEVLVLLDVHPSVQRAREALRAATSDLPAEPVDGGWQGLCRLAGTRIRWDRMWRRSPRIAPGAGLLIGAVRHDSAMERLARRATAQYRPREKR